MKSFYDYIQLVEMDAGADPDQIELKQNLEKFMGKLNMIMQKTDQSRAQAKGFLEKVIGDIINTYGLKVGDVRSAMAGALSQGNEVKTPPQQPQAV